MINRLPVWFKQKLPSDEALQFSAILRDKFKLNTVCHSAKCPNSSECFHNKHATFLILGNRCTRSCKFCNIEYCFVSEKKSNQQLLVDKNEPYRIAQAVNYYDLEYIVITSVTRDDLSDGGASHFVQTIKAIKENNANIKIEVLIPDFKGSRQALGSVVDSKPEIIAHNLETVERIYPLVRSRADYNRSLEVLRSIKSLNPSQITKTSVMLGLGETEEDLRESLYDLREVNCDMLVLGQYLRPTLVNYPVKKFYSPHEFKIWEKFAYSLGFRSVYASPLARTSYLAKEQEKCMTL
ncbi:MAG: lipoyl synthase [Candidatus Omnitrophota bacterium]